MLNRLSHSHNPDLAVFLIRLALGLVFIFHGWGKLGNLAGTAEFFLSVGVPAFLATIVALVEFAGGIMMILGIWTRVVAWFFAIIMLGAILFAKASKGFGGYEFELVLLLASLAVAYMPAGKWTAHRMLRRS